MANFPNLPCMEEKPTTESANDNLPKYGSRPKKPGLYLGLFHGREVPTQLMSDWGFDGPQIGPLRWCHTSYAHVVKLEFESAVDAAIYFGAGSVQFELRTDGDLLKVDGKYYGDWTVFYVPPEDCERPLDTFRLTMRANQLLAHRKHLR